MIRKRMSLYGSVQGVGLRYRAYYAARTYGITGWVRNEEDGSVSLEVQGERADIDAMMEAVQNGHFVSIDGIDARVIPLDAEERDFMVKD